MKGRGNSQSPRCSERPLAHSQSARWRYSDTTAPNTMHMQMSPTWASVGKLWPSCRGLPGAALRNV